MKRINNNRQLFKRILLGVSVAAFTTSPTIALADERADEMQSNTQGSLYEKDAWWDVTEWFDGNDYNPTDEAWFRWDDEFYNDGDAITSSDKDSDASGELERTNTYVARNYDDFTDFDRDGTYEIASTYFDYDNDGYYDAYASYSDTDGDGVFDNYTFLNFELAGTAEKATKKLKSDAKKGVAKAKSKPMTVSGTIHELRNAKIGGKNATNLVAVVERESGDQFLVDLGKRERLERIPAEGDAFTASGFASRANGKDILIANRFAIDGDKATVDRSPHSIEGEVVDSIAVNVRGNEHLLLKLETADKKRALVDMGRMDKLATKPRNGESVQATGVAVKVNNRRMLFATRASLRGKKLNIDRKMPSTDQQALKNGGGAQSAKIASNEQE